MLYWTSYPFIRILIALIFGIIAAESTDQALISIHQVLYLFLALVLAKFLFRKVSNTIWGNVLLVLVFLIGYANSANHRTAENHPFSKDNQQSQAYLGVVSSYPSVKGKNLVFQVDASSTIKNNSIMEAASKVSIYLKMDDSVSYLPKYGDQVLIQGRPRPMSPPKNPYGFDYRAFMANRGICCQQMIEDDQIRQVSEHHANPLLYHAFQIRSQLEREIESLVPGRKAQNIIKALLLGVKNDLDAETKSAFAAAGAMHILAVSGLHVSVVYFMVHWLLSLFPSVTMKRWVTPSASILALWLYALLTGLSPSILRAVTMITIVISSQLFLRRTNIFNSLAFAAFVLLIFNPNFLVDVGFQLSFLAVGGIIYLQPKIAALWTVRNWLGDKVWQLTSVSLAAQLATFPVGLYYFHQFPTYFLFTNLVVIPGAFVIMILALAMLVFGGWFGWLGTACGYAVNALNTFVGFIESLDGSVIDEVSISVAMVCLIYLLIYSVFCFFQYKNFSYLWWVVGISLAIATIRLNNTITQANQDQLVFYSTLKGLLMDQISGLRARLISMDSVVAEKTIKFTVSPYRMHASIPSSYQIWSIEDNFREVGAAKVFNGMKLLFINKVLAPAQFNSRLTADIVVISNQSIKSIVDLSALVDCKKVILDGSNSYGYRMRIKNEARETGIEVVDLTQSYYIINLSGN